jgi:hypothetical protein
MTTTNQRADHGTGWLDGVLVLAVLGLAGLLGCAVIRNSDIWMHLATGRLIANGQYHVGVDPFCHTTANDIWINHAWGFDIGMYGVFQQFGGAGLVILRCGIVVILTLALLINRKPGSGFAVPAMVAALALVAANVRLPIFQPTVVSYMVLAVLMWLLQVGPTWRRRWWLPVAVFLLHVYWVNHDGWFLIGPCVIALWLIGSWLQPREEGEPIAGFWLGVFACAWIGCFVNPHYVRAFAIPDDLVPTLTGSSVGGHIYFNPFDTEFRRSQPAPVFAAVAIWTIGLTSFFLPFTTKSWRRLLLWTALAMLAIWRARLVPFFAIGTAPLVVHNIQDWLCRLEPSANRRLVGVAVRSAAALAVIGLGFAAWPGWLGPMANDPTRAYRVGLRLESNVGLERLASQLNDLQSSGVLTRDERVYSPSTDVSHYVAWFAPSLKSFIDTRWRLHFDRFDAFVAGRQFFSALDNGQDADLKQMTNAMRPYAITLLILSGSDRGDGTGAARVLFTKPEQWPLLALSGKTTAFAWNVDGNVSRPSLNVPKLAFSPQTAPHLPPPPDDEPKAETMWERYVHGIPPRSLNLEEALAWLEYSDACQFRVDSGRSLSALATFAFGPGGDSAWPLRAVMNFHPAARPSPNRVVAPDRMAAPLLAVRHARAALVSQYDSAEAAYRLAQAYSRMASVESMLSLQQGAALTQAQTRLDIFAAYGWDESQIAFRIANDLMAFHARFNTQQVVADVFVDDFRTALELMRRPRVAELFADKKTYEAEFNGRKKQLENMEKALAAQREHLITDMSQPPINRMVTAEQLGLPGEALNIFRHTLTEHADQLSIRDMAYGIGLMLRVGRAEEARMILHSPQFNPVTSIDPAFQPVFRRFHLEAAIACGDYQRARDELSTLFDLTRLGQARNQSTAAVALATGAIAFDPVAAPFLSRGFISFMWTSPFAQQLSLRQQRFEMMAWQTLLALEEGDTRNAKRAADEALEEPPPGVRPYELEALTLYKILLDRAAQTAP